ncbi:hypothetical protein HWV62_6108 [Athelia sp. TMB]|nr:hypothetical protein HWV62_6108 [Athelia sp. TMB]
MLPRSLLTLPRRLPRLNARRYTASSPATASSPSPVTKVEKIIRDNIRATGPISLASYMQFCLAHPTHGYYANPAQPVFGARGDFTTSPEISQVFGELVGVWLVSQWMAHAAKCKVAGTIRLVELGPGRGTLMADVLRVVARFPAARAALARVHLVDNSAHMQALQRRTLAHSGFAERVEWHASLEDVPAVEEGDVYTMLVAHEFFDALPINLLERTEQGWHEVLIANNPPPSAPDADPAAPSTTATPPPTPENPDPAAPFRLVLTPAPTPQSTLLGLSSPRFLTLPPGARVEVSHAAFKAARRLADVLAGGGRSAAAVWQKGAAGAGAGLVVDYGADGAADNSFRAFKDHAPADPLARAGECDLTANVDFAYLREALAGLATAHGPLPQRAFLARMGLRARLDALVRAAPTPARARDIEAAAARLVDAEGMGVEYKVLGVTVGGGGEGEGKEGEEVWPFVQLGEEVDAGVD